MTFSKNYKSRYYQYRYMLIFPSTEHSALFRLFFFFFAYLYAKLLYTHEFPQITSSHTGISTFLLLHTLGAADSNGCGQYILLVYARAALEMGKITLSYLLH